MPTKTRDERYGEVLHRHWAAERAEFDLRPSDIPPCLASGSTCVHPPNTAGFASWPRARALRAKILAADPHHYDELDRLKP
jgi:hypothetical protein